MTADKTPDLDVVDVLLRDSAERAANAETSTPAERRADEAVVAALHARIADLRRARLPAAVPPRKAGPVRGDLLDLGRDALLARLEAVTQLFAGEVQYAHRDLDELTDDDLRRLVDMVEPDERGD
jgi:hypothetical protein